jgi:transposase InsO family protein
MDTAVDEARLKSEEEAMQDATSDVYGSEAGRSAENRALVSPPLEPSWRMSNPMQELVKAHRKQLTTYDGRLREYKQFCQALDDFFDIVEGSLTAADEVKYATAYLKGRAHEWWKGVRKEGKEDPRKQVKTWVQLQAQLRAYFFSPFDEAQVRFAFRTIRQHNDEDVQAFWLRFHAQYQQVSANPVYTLSAAWQSHLWFHALSIPIRQGLSQQGVNDQLPLEDLLQRALGMESSLRASQHMQSRSNFTSSYGKPKVTLVANSSARDLGSAPTPSSNLDPRTGASRLSFKEIQHLKKLRACFVCRVPNADHLAKDCPRKGTTAEINSTTAATVVECQSLKAQDSPHSQAPISQVFLKSGSICGTPVTVMLDTGCEANIIRRDVANALGLPLRPTNVEMQFGQPGVVQRTVEEVECSLLVEGECMARQFLVADVRYDVMLGVPWHEAHSPYTSGLRQGRKYLEFTNEGKRLCWWGEDGLPPNQRSLPLTVEHLDPRELKQILDGGGLNNGFMVEVSDTRVAESAAVHPLVDLVVKYRDVFVEPTSLPPERGVEHEINLTPDAQPLHRPIYHLSPVELAEMRAQLDVLLEKGFIQPSKSPWGSPVIFVPKKDGGLRCCIDYRGLNQVTIKDRTPLPNMAELRDRLEGAQFFTKMDLREGYYNIRVRKEDIPKTAFRTRFGHFEFKVMPFGLTNAPATFMRLMNKIFYDLYDICLVVYLDDLLVFSKTLSDHRKHVEEVFRRLRNNTLFVKESKCRFAVGKVEFCGHVVGSNGTEIDPKKLEVVTNWPALANVRDVRKFLGFTNYFKQFIDKYAEFTHPLTNLLRKNEPWQWGTEEQEAQRNLIAAVTSAPVLAHYDPSLPVVVHTDASAYAIGGWLGQPQQKVGGRDELGTAALRPVLFWSRKMKGAETRYPVHEQELLALVEFLATARHYVAVPDVIARTDHKALIWLNQQKHLSVRQARWVAALQQYDLHVEYLPGEWNTVADALSRRPDYIPRCAECRSRVDVGAILIDSTTNEFMAQLREALKSDDLALEITQQLEAPAEHQSARTQRFQWDNGLLKYERKRLYVPDVPQFRMQILQDHHDAKTASHRSWQATYEKIARGYYWPKLERDIKNYIQTCDECQRSKDRTSAPAGRLRPIAASTDAPWATVAMDFAALPKSKSGKDSVLVVVDKFTKRVRLIPTTRKVTALETARLFIDNIIKLHGFPEAIISDRDARFTSQFWKALTETLGIELWMSTARHQQTDGQAERTIKTVKEALRVINSYGLKDWEKDLGMIEFAINDSISSTTGFTPFMLDNGRHPRAPVLSEAAVYTTAPSARELAKNLQSIWAVVKDRIRNSQDSQAKQADKYRRDGQIFKIGDEVLVRRDGIKTDLGQPSEQLNPRFLGPYKIMEICKTPFTFKLDLPAQLAKLHSEFHIDVLAPYHQPDKYFAERTAINRPQPALSKGKHSLQVREILKHRTINGQHQYLVHWQGYPKEEATWEPRCRVEDEEAFRNFEKENVDSIDVIPWSLEGF